MSAEIDRLLNDGIAAAKSGNDAIARELLSRVVERDPRHVPAWLWLASVVESEGELRTCLENILALDPGNETARARLAMLESMQAPARVEAPPPAPFVVDDFAPETYPDEPPSALARAGGMGCPYCGQEFGIDVRVCPYCRGRLVIARLKDSPFPNRIWLLAASWVLLLLVYATMDGLAIWALRALASGGSQPAPLTSYGKSVITSYVLNPMAGQEAATWTVLLRVFMISEGVLIGWSLVMAIVLPARRPGVVPAAGFVLLIGLVLQVFEIIVGFYVSLLKLAATLAVGAFLATSLGDFVWESARYELGLDRGLKSALDYYNRGRRYREQGMLANAILHWQRAAAMEPDRAAFHIALANVLYQAGRYRESGEQIQAALGRLPFTSPEAEDLRRFAERVQAKVDADGR